MIIQRLRQAKGLPLLGHVTLRDLTRGMNACICAPCRSDGGHIRLKLCKRSLNRTLHRGLISLTLPPRKGATIIFDFERITGHGFG